MGFTFYIENVRVFFPFDRIYPEQYQYMVPPCPRDRAALGASLVAMDEAMFENTEIQVFGRNVRVFALVSENVPRRFQQVCIVFQNGHHQLDVDNLNVGLLLFGYVLCTIPNIRIATNTTIVRERII